MFTAKTSRSGSTPRSASAVAKSPKRLGSTRRFCGRTIAASSRARPTRRWPSCGRSWTSWTRAGRAAWTGPVKIPGLVPGGSRLKSYFRKFESASRQIDRLVHQLGAAQDDLERDAIAIEDAKVQLWAALQNLKAAAHFAQVLEKKLAAQVDGLKGTDPLRARALEQQALCYAAQNLDGILAQLAVSVNGYLALEPLKKIARELSNGIERLKTTGMSALAIAQMVALATGNQVRIQQVMARTREVAGNLTVRTSTMRGEHARTAGKSASDPAIEIGKLQAAFDDSFKAMDAMDGYRSAAIQDARQEQRDAARAAREVETQLGAGPVAL
jgi:uncharacterized protein YaaN involved in tellurite resistance